MYHTGEYAHALTFFETVLGLDPHRTEVDDLCEIRVLDIFLDV